MKFFKLQCIQAVVHFVSIFSQGHYNIVMGKKYPTGPRILLFIPLLKWHQETSLSLFGQRPKFLLILSTKILQLWCPLETIVEVFLRPAVNFNRSLIGYAQIFHRRFYLDSAALHMNPIEIYLFHYNRGYHQPFEGVLFHVSHLHAWLEVPVEGVNQTFIL